MAKLDAKWSKVAEDVKRVLAESGLELHGFRVTISPTDGQHRISLGAHEPQKTADGTVVSAQEVGWAESWKWGAGLYDLKPEWLGQTLRITHNTYTIMGIAPRKTKKPVIIKRRDGKIFNADADQVRRCMLGRE